MKRLILITVLAFAVCATAEAGPLHWFTHLSIHSIGKGIGKGVAKVAKVFY